MKKLRYSVDFTWYNFIQEDALCVEGWAFLPDKDTLDVQVTDQGGEPLPHRVTWKERPDIGQVLSEEKLPGRPGFTIAIPGITAHLKKLTSLSIHLGDKEEQEVVLRLNRGKIEKIICDAVIIYQVDEQTMLETSLVIQGWCIDQLGRDEIQVVDDKDRELPCEIYRTVREDARIKYREYTRDKQEVGFTVKVPTGELSTDVIKVRFLSLSTYKEYVVDLKELRRESTRNGRLYNALRPGKFTENVQTIRQEGFASFREQVQKYVSQEHLDYTRWVKKHQPTALDIRRQREHNFQLNPKISIIIPLYHTPIKYLKQLLKSITTQTYENWELCLADGSVEDTVEKYIRSHCRKDARISYKRLKENRGISDNTNAALTMATGDYIMLSDHDDMVEQGALYEIVKAINENPDVDILYTDEDKITMDGRDYFEPNFKSDFNPYMMESNNYICHIFVVRTSIMDQIHGFRREFDGAQDYDLILRCWEATSEDKICHIPRVLYHWRSHPGSTATNPDSKRYAYEAGARALNEHFARRGVKAHAEITENLGIYRIYREVKGHPFISIIIPNKDHTEDLEKCLSSIAQKTTYDNYEILVVENNSTDAATFAYYQEMEERYPRVKLLTWEREFNYAAINNFAAEQAQGDYYLFLNNDVELITDNWLEEFLGIAQDPAVGIVGARLYYPDETIQHSGVILGLGGVAGHIFSGISRYEPTYVGRAIMPHNLSAVTAACMMMRADVFRQVEGFDETFRVAFNDVDLCMKTRQAGYQVVYNPYVELYHYESKSRGLEDTKDKEDRFFGEVQHFREKWQSVLDKGDPYYNVNLSLEDGNCHPGES